MARPMRTFTASTRLKLDGPTLVVGLRAFTVEFWIVPALWSRRT
jgi:hypothetical protein